MMQSNLRIDLERLMGRIMRLAEIGAIDGGGVCRLALSDEDKQARDLVSGWMRDLGLDVSIDAIGNIIGIRPGTENGPPVMTGSHIDSVATGGKYDGALGVLAGLEAIAVLNDADVTTRRPIAVAAFTNEEGARFAPDMMGSAVHQGSLDLDDALGVTGIDGASVGDELVRIGYDGDKTVGNSTVHCFIEYHVEQGPVLEEGSITVGAVTGVQGISWTEYKIEGVSNHAGTTPMRLRHDAGYVAGAIAVEARRITLEIGGDQVATVGVTELTPGLVNVIAKEALVTVDLRNTDESELQKAEKRINDFIREISTKEGVTVTSRTLARFEPVVFDPEMIDLVDETAAALGYSVSRMPSGAGHDAQMFAPGCPTTMIFVPSKDGISHNVNEHTSPQEIRAGADILLQVLLAKAQ
jgi:N-carbamoyl-L-amino-acid hydrolase